MNGGTVLGAGIAGELSGAAERLSPNRPQTRRGALGGGFQFAYTFGQRGELIFHFAGEVT